MINTPKIKSIYSEIQTKLFYMVPERWNRIYLYASVIENINNIETGEMFFYYFPKGILKKNSVNVYEVPAKFNIDEKAYLKLADDLYKKIKELRKELQLSGERPWSNITISIENFKFNVEYSYENLISSKYSNYDRHIIWKYKYLGYPIERLNKKEKKMIEEYLIEEKFKINDMANYSEKVYASEVHNIIEYDKQENNIIVENKDKENKIKQEKNIIKEEMKKQQKRQEIMSKYDLYKKQEAKMNLEKSKKQPIKEQSEVQKKKNQILNF